MSFFGCLGGTPEVYISYAIECYSIGDLFFDFLFLHRED